MGRTKNIYYDHKGNQYTSMSRLCNAYGINPNKMVTLVRNHGYSVNKAFKILLDKYGYKEETQDNAPAYVVQDTKTK